MRGVDMFRSIFVLALASSLAVACSRPAPQQAAESGGTPPAAAAQGGPAGAATTPAGQAQPTSAEAPPATSAQASTPPPPAEPPPPPEPPKPKFKEVTIPTGTSLSVTLATPLASDSSQPEDRIKGALAKSI